MSTHLDLIQVLYSICLVIPLRNQYGRRRNLDYITFLHWHLTKNISQLFFLCNTILVSQCLFPLFPPLSFSACLFSVQCCHFTTNGFLFIEKSDITGCYSYEQSSLAEPEVEKENLVVQTIHSSQFDVSNWIRMVPYVGQLHQLNCQHSPIVAVSCCNKQFCLFWILLSYSKSLE